MIVRGIRRRVFRVIPLTTIPLTTPASPSSAIALVAAGRAVSSKNAIRQGRGERGPGARVCDRSQTRAPANPFSTFWKARGNRAAGFPAARITRPGTASLQGTGRMCPLGIIGVKRYGALEIVNVPITKPKLSFVPSETASSLNPNQSSPLRSVVNCPLVPTYQ